MKYEFTVGQAWHVRLNYYTTPSYSMIVTFKGPCGVEYTESIWIKDRKKKAHMMKTDRVMFSMVMGKWLPADDKTLDKLTHNLALEICKHHLRRYANRYGYVLGKEPPTLLIPRKPRGKMAGLVRRSL